MIYTDALRARMLRRMMGPNPVSQKTLSRETGIPQTTLSGWLRDVITSPVMTQRRPKDEDPPARRPEDWSPEEKLQLIVEASQMDDDRLGEFLRQKGLHKPQLEEWRQAARDALRGSTKTGRIGAERRIKDLERDLRRKDKALAETAALLVLRKKVDALWGDADDDTDDKSET